MNSRTGMFSAIALTGGVGGMLNPGGLHSLPIILMVIFGAGGLGWVLGTIADRE